MIKGKNERDAASKAVLDNMARLKALRLAREAAEPPRAVTAKKVRVKAKVAGRQKAPDLVRVAREVSKTAAPNLRPGG